MQFLYLNNLNGQLGSVVHTCNLSTGEVEVEHQKQFKIISNIVS